MRTFFKRTIFLLCSIFLICNYINQQKPDFSIIIPTHNRAHLLPELFKSIDSSTHKNFEVIFINDASTDNTKEVLSKYAKTKGKSPQIVILNNPQNLGMEGTRNRGISKARGKYLAFMDDDDVFYPDWLEKSLDYLTKNPDVDAVIPLKHHLTTPPTPQYNVSFSWILSVNVMGMGATVIKRDFIQKHGILFNKKFEGAEDYDFFRNVLKNGGIIRRLPYFLTAIRAGATHSTQHYINQAKSNRLISADLKKYYSPDNKIYNLCNIWRNIQKTEKFARQFEPHEIIKEVKDNCRIYHLKEDVRWLFFHPNWQDAMIKIDEKTVYRSGKKDDIATILSINDNKITIKWHKWGTETFVCEQGSNECILKTNTP